MGSLHGNRLRNVLFLLFSIRSKQGFRWVQSLGWIRFFILLLSSISIFLIPILPFFVTATILLLVHISRKDKRFLKFTKVPAYQVFLIEYLTISLPALLYGVLSQQWWYLLLLIPLIVLPGLPLSYNKSVKNSFLPVDYIPLKLFEWRSGIRKAPYLYLALYILLLVTGFKIRYVHMLSLIIIALLILPGNYMNCEPFQFLEVYNKPACLFLIEKFLYAILGYSVLAGPFILLSLIEQLSEWYITAGFLLAAIFIIANVVWNKYANYDPGRDLGHATSSYSFFTILYVGICFPPLLLVTSAWFYWKGNKRLKKYLYAFH